MDELINLVGEGGLAVVILAAWVVATHREKTKLQEKLLDCFDELKRKNTDD